MGVRADRAWEHGSVRTTPGFILAQSDWRVRGFWLIPDHPITMLLSYFMWFTVMCCGKWCDQSAGLYSLTFFYYYKSRLVCKLLLNQLIIIKQVLLVDQRKKHLAEVAPLPIWPHGILLVSVGRRIHFLPCLNCAMNYTYNIWVPKKFCKANKVAVCRKYQ